MTMKKVLLLLLPDRADVTSPLSIAVARAICSHLTIVVIIIVIIVGIIIVIIVTIMFFHMMTIIIIDIIIFIVFQIFWVTNA